MPLFLLIILVFLYCIMCFKEICIRLLNQVLLRSKLRYLIVDLLNYKKTLNVKKMYIEKKLAKLLSFI